MRSSCCAGALSTPSRNAINEQTEERGAKPLRSGRAPLPPPRGVMPLAQPNVAFILDQLIARAADRDSFERWMRQVQHAGHCARPVRPVGCWRRHEPNDYTLGTPLCAECFDYQAAVLWNALAPELWRRTTIYLRRALARRAGMPAADFRRSARLSYAKVAEYQQRGAVHFHAVIRLDAAPPPDDPNRVEPPPAPFTAELLAEAIRDATAAVAVALPSTRRAPARAIGWGEQLDIQTIEAGTNAGETLSAEAVAAYIAKYATKSTEGFGPALDHRLTAGDLDHLDVSEHVAELVRTCWRLGADPSLAGLGLRRWAHMLGFRGHWSTKSRRYSTTFTALRRARVEHIRRRLLD